MDLPTEITLRCLGEKWIAYATPQGDQYVRAATARRPEKAVKKLLDTLGRIV